MRKHVVGNLTQDTSSSHLLWEACRVVQPIAEWWGTHSTISTCEQCPLFGVSVSWFCIIISIFFTPFPCTAVPGDGGNQLWATLNKTQAPHYYCELHSELFNLWLNIEELFPYFIDCFVDNIRLVDLVKLNFSHVSISLYHSSWWWRQPVMGHTEQDTRSTCMVWEPC